ncbi:MAG: AAA family ATPase [Nanoarchaeota archaeon]|nr:AAA family ATPase [Nanoarchaeota archaeon]
MENDKIRYSIDKQRPEVSANSSSFAFEPYLPHDLHIPDLIQDSIFRREMDASIRKKLKHLSGKGAVIHGFQGTGKTALVKYLAKEDDALLIEVSKEDSSNVTKAKFAEAKSLAGQGKKVYVVLDEIDSFGTKESLVADVAKISNLLKEIDGTDQNPVVNDNLYYFGLTNYLEGVDQRLMRSGRLEELVEIPLPNLDSRRKITSILLENLEYNKKIKPYIHTIATKTRGYTPADLRGLLKHISIDVLDRKGKLNEETILKKIQTFPTSAKKGFEYFKEPLFGKEDLIGREIYLDFFEKVIGKNSSANFLYYGPNGTGKTLLPEVLANIYEMNYIEVKGSELQIGIVGEGTKKIKRLINLAKIASPCIILVDEGEGMVSSRGIKSHRDDETAYLSSVLSRQINGVYFFMTTNTPHLLNETILTRFPHKIFCELPNEMERRNYLNRFDMPLSSSNLEGYSFRDLENLKRVYEMYGDEILNSFLEKYSPENRNRSENWNKIKLHIGDSMELEKIVNNLGDKE